ncbi:MAG: ComEC/Rec2 family competence protein [Armatimonadota bacterium]|nr:ComEC/Rec2 family competence protein [Armatimonadota bacterium]
MAEAQFPTNLSPLKRPLGPPAVALALGILAAEYAGLPAALAVACGAAALALMSVWKERQMGITALILAATFCLGAARYGLYTQVRPDDVSQYIGAGSVAVVGVVKADPEMTRKGARLIVDVNRVGRHGKWEQTTGSLQIFVYAPSERMRKALPQYGDKILLRGRLTAPFEPTNPGMFSYRKYLARQRVYATMFAGAPNEVRVLDSGLANPAVTLASRVRESISESIKKLMPEPQAGVAIGMALGTYSTLPDEIFANFSRTGTLHLLAASGFNCAVIMVTVLLLFRRIPVQRRWAYAAAIPALLLYMLVVGPKPSIIRATIMAVFLAGAYILRRISDPLNVLFAAALVILAIKPTDLFDVGFQLSFAATLSIILMLPILERLAAKVSADEPPPKRFSSATAVAWTGKCLMGGLLVTTAATLGTMPIGAHYFNYVSLVSIPTNAAVVLFIPAIFVISLFSPVLAVIPFAGQAIASIGTILISYLLATVSFFGSATWGFLPLRSFGAAGIAGYYLIMGTAISYVSRRVHG